MSKNQPNPAGNEGASSKEEDKFQSSIWLEVANVRLENEGVQIQVKGDRADREPVWRNVELEGTSFYKDGKPDHNAAYRSITDGLDKKRIVLANLTVQDGKTLKCTYIRVQYAESNSR